VRFDLPAPEAETQPFWDAARERRLLIKRCADCGAAHFYPRPFCPRCWCEQVSWEDASGAATLYTYSTVHVNDLPPFPERVPYVAAIVELVEGPRMMTNVVDCEPERIEVGMSLQVTYRDLDDEFTIPVFAPTAAS
jgi:uncharacterized OB-fold protein